MGVDGLQEKQPAVAMQKNLEEVYDGSIIIVASGNFSKTSLWLKNNQHEDMGFWGKVNTENNNQPEHVGGREHCCFPEVQGIFLENNLQ